MTNQSQRKRTRKRGNKKPRPRLHGWMGKRLRLDLTEKTFKIEDLPLSYYKRWVGGRGLNAGVVHDETEPGMDPFDPQNPLCFAAGALTGTFAPLSGRTAINAYSPNACSTLEENLFGLDGTTMADAFGPRMKYAGFDQVVVTGRAEEPVYVFINDGTIEFRDARHLWGQGVKKATNAILEELADFEVNIALIGPAGENLVKFACITSAFHPSGGRTGMGAVMGSKNLKALVVRGTQPIHLAHPGEFIKYCWRLREMIHDASQTIRQKIEAPDSPVRDIKKAYDKSVEAKQLLSRRTSCWSCPVACGKFTYINEGKYGGFHCSEPEMERICRLEPGPAGGDAAGIAALCGQAGDLGMDSVLSFATLSWISDAIEQGRISEKDTGGIRLEKGDIEGSIKVLDMIGRRTGIGDLLAEGTGQAAGALGVRGELKIKSSDKQTGRRDNTAFMSSERIRCIADAVGGCCQAMGFWKGVRSWQDTYAPLFMHATGVEMGEKEILKKAERIIKIENTLWSNGKTGRNQKR